MKILLTDPHIEGPTDRSDLASHDVAIEIMRDKFLVVKHRYASCGEFDTIDEAILQLNTKEK